MTGLWQVPDMAVVVTTLVVETARYGATKVATTGFAKLQLVTSDQCSVTKRITA